MIAFLRGLVCSRGEDHVVVDVSGVGYHVSMAPPAVRALAHGEEVQLHIHTHVREDALQLFGFAHERQREIFLALKKVKGIGPKLAMAVLGNTTIDGLVSTVGAGDVKQLTHIPGLGKKTAERIVLELQGVFGKMTPAGPMPSGPRQSDGSAMLNDVASALSNLGFKSAPIDRALDELRLRQDLPEDFDAVFREAMRLVR